MGFQRITDKDSLNDLLDDDAIIFKHSERCGISQSRRNALADWMNDHSEDIHTVEVRQQRGLSDRIEDVTGVKHESPQIFVIRDGEVTWHASHMSIEPERLSEQV